jgi:Regulator of chromosome condensation (RCC1) repeat
VVAGEASCTRQRKPRHFLSLIGSRQERKPTCLQFEKGKTKGKVRETASVHLLLTDSYSRCSSLYIYYNIRLLPGTLVGVRGAAGGWGHTVVVTEGGEVHAYGWNGHGQVPDHLLRSKTTNRDNHGYVDWPVPIPIGQGLRVDKVAAGEEHWQVTNYTSIPVVDR